MTGKKILPLLQKKNNKEQCGTTASTRRCGGRKRKETRGRDAQKPRGTRVERMS